MPSNPSTRISPDIHICSLAQSVPFLRALSSISFSPALQFQRRRPRTPGILLFSPIRRHRGLALVLPNLKCSKLRWIPLGLKFLKHKQRMSNGGVMGVVGRTSMAVNIFPIQTRVSSGGARHTIGRNGLDDCGNAFPQMNGNLIDGRFRNESSKSLGESLTVSRLPASPLQIRPSQDVPPSLQPSGNRQTPTPHLMVQVLRGCPRSPCR